MAQTNPAFIREVRPLEVDQAGIQNPAGLAFSPGANAFHVVEGHSPGQPPPANTDIVKMTALADRTGSAQIAAAIKDPINMTFDSRFNRLLIFQFPANQLIEVLEDPDGNLDPSTMIRHNVQHFDLQNPQGMAVDPVSGDLFILDSAVPRLVRVEPEADGSFDKAVISVVDLTSTDLLDPRGLALDPTTGHLHIVNPAEQELYELTQTGQVVTTRNLAAFELGHPQGMVFAPSGDLTDDPAEISLYITDSGLPGVQQNQHGQAGPNPAPGVQLYLPLILRGANGDKIVMPGPGPDEVTAAAAQTSGDIVELSFTALAEPAASTFASSLVNTVDMSQWSPPSPDPSGLAYLSSSNHLIMDDGEVEETVNGITHFEGANVWEMTLSGSVVDTANISKVEPTVLPITNEPTGVAWNPANGHYFFVQDSGDTVFELASGTDGQYFTADDIVTSFALTGQNGDGEGLAFDSWNNRLFVADGVNMEIYEYTLSGSLVGQYDVEQYGVADPESVEFNPDTGTLFVMSSNRSSPVVIETTTSGDLLQTIDISAAGARTAAGLAYAPASDSSGAQRFYIVDRGIDNNSDPNIIDGKMYELTAPTPVTGPVPPIANDDSASTVLDTPVTIDVAANDTDPNGNLDPTTANNTCNPTCSNPSNGTLVNNRDGSFTYTPDAGFSGSDSFIYEICDTDDLCDTAAATITIGLSTVEVRVAASSDDAEEAASGGMTLGSSDLELVLESSAQTVGMRFNGITIPQGAAIINAYIQFQTDETNSEATDLIIEGEASDNATTFISSGGNISSRPRTSASVAWSPPPWTTVGEAGPDQQTPDISTVIQEIVTRSGWANGNSLAIIITGSGKRVAEAYNGVSTAAPLLRVEYSASGNHNPPTAVDDAYTTDEDTPLNVAAPGVLANDSDEDGDPLTAVLDGSPANGTLTLNADGSFIYTPNADFNGADTFSYHANDGITDSSVATVSLTINAVNDPPMVVNDTYSIDEGTPLNVAAPGVLANDSDGDGDPLTAVLDGSPANGTLTLNANGSFTYTPNANFTGLDTFSYRANDGTADSNVATVTLTVNAVNDPPVANDDAYATDEDTPLNVAAPGVLANDSDVDGDPLTAVLDGNPANGTLTLNADGSFIYTPNADFNGADTFSYHANDGITDSSVATVSLTINAVNDPPTAVDDTYTTDEGTPLNVAAPGVLANDSDGDGDPLTAGLVSDVSNGTLNLATDGSFTYTPAPGFVGSDSFTYRANDGTADSNVATVNITINAVNNPPTAVDDTYTTDEDTPLNVAAPGVLANDSDGDGDPLTAVLDGGPANGTLTLNGDGSFSYTPNANFNGSDSFTYTANDGAANSNIAAVTITVNPVNDPPTAVGDAYSTNEDTVLTVPAPGMLGNDSDVDGDPLTAVLNTSPSNGSLTLNSNGSFSYTPNANFNGSDSFTYTANDGQVNSNIATVTIAVNAVNNPPTAVGDAYSTNEDTVLTVPAPGVLANDTDPENAPLTAVLDGGPSNGSLTLNSDGSFTYTPNANFTGLDTFSYHANDGTADSNVATVSITVNPVNDPPTAVDDAYSTDEGTPLNVAAPGVLANDSDGDGDPLTAVLEGSPANGTLTLDANGSFTYTPNANFTGLDTFSYHANDGTADSNVATVSITVNAVNDPPVANDDAYATDEDTPLNVAAPGVLANDTDSENAPLTAVLDGGPSNGSLILNSDGSFTYTPNADFTGSDSFTYRANDGTADSNVATVSITVNPINDPPTAVDDAYSTDEDTPLNVAAPGVLANDTDTENDPLTAVLDTPPSNGSLTLNSDGSFTYTPNADFNGTDSFTYRANDGTVDSNVATVFISVIAAPISVTNIDSNTMQAGATINVTITGSSFAAGATVTFENGSGPAPAAANIVVAPDGKSLTASITAKSGGPPRDRVWDVRVTNPDGSSAVLAAGFTVTP